MALVSDLVTIAMKRFLEQNVTDNWLAHIMMHMSNNYIFPLSTTIGHIYLNFPSCSLGLKHYAKNDILCHW